MKTRSSSGGRIRHGGRGSTAGWAPRIRPRCSWERLARSGAHFFPFWHGIADNYTAGAFADSRRHCISGMPTRELSRPETSRTATSTAFTAAKHAVS